MRISKKRRPVALAVAMMVRREARLLRLANALSPSGIPNWLEALKPDNALTDYPGLSEVSVNQVWWELMGASTISDPQGNTIWYQHSEMLFFPAHNAEQLADFMAGRPTASEFDTRSLVILGHTGIPGITPADYFHFGPAALHDTGVKVYWNLPWVNLGD